jgi:hypothetical protein
MAFITGCGRSGTTILGRLIEQHPDVRYLNDRFDLWIRPFPFTDIWGRRMDSHRVGARIALTADDAAAAPQPARNWFAGLMDAEREGRPVLVEKIAINNFRVGFLAALCPGARFINILRHGVEVARSIEQKAALGHWYGTSDRKWTLLVEHAWANGYGPLVGLCSTPFLRGLLEWRMSVEAAEGGLAALPPEAVLRLRYEDLIADSVAIVRRMTDVLGLARNDHVERFAAAEVQRRSAAAAPGHAPPGTEEIAGATLRRLGYSV